MRYEMVAPPLGLSGIRCIWSLESAGGGPVEPQRVVPDGCVELVLNLGDPFRVFSETGSSLQPAAMIVADSRRPLVIAPTGRTDIIAVRFEPGGATPYLGAPMPALVDRSFALGDVRPGLNGLAGRLAECTPDRRAGLLARELARSAIARLAPDPRVVAAARLVTGSAGRVPLDVVTRLTGASPRWLQRRFRDAVGFGPKLLARINRFHALVSALDRSASPHWARLASAHGYFDQAHLIRDFRAFAGTTPAAWLREPNALNALFARPA